MQQSILTINAGSSSVKFALFELAEHIAEKAAISGQIDGIGTAHVRLVAKDNTGTRIVDQALPAGADHATSFDQLLHWFSSSAKGGKIVAVGHRVVHGGEKFAKSVVITDEVMQAIEECNPLAPLHNPANIIGIKACQELMPGVPMVAVFDTAFHQTMPPVAFRYPLPKALYSEHKIRRYGFHGTSHAYVSERASHITSATGPHGWLTAHLGNGCSATAVYDGKSLDTSMGLTPLEGLMMGTRSGDVDPSLHIHLKRQLGMSLEEIDKMLNSESGLLGISGLSNDLRTIEQAANEGHEDAKLAIEMFCYRVGKYLASLSCALPNFTGIVFTGGIGENSVTTRTRILEVMRHFGIKVDADKNAGLVGGNEGSFHTDDSSIELWVVPTDEECRIAQETRAALGLK